MSELKIPYKRGVLPAYKLGWVAGVLDYKGTVVVKNNTQRADGHRQLCLMVETVNLAVAEELCRLTGTAPEGKQHRPRKDWMRRGCVTHCPEPDVEYPGQASLPEQARWTVTGAAAIIVLSAVQPYMVTDRGVSSLLAEAQASLVTSGRGVGNVRKSVNRLAGLGWPVPAKLRKIAQPVPAEAARRHRTAAQIGGVA